MLDCKYILITQLSSWFLGATTARAIGERTIRDLFVSFKSLVLSPFLFYFLFFFSFRSCFGCRLAAKAGRASAAKQNMKRKEEDKKMKVS